MPDSESNQPSEESSESERVAVVKAIADTFKTEVTDSEKIKELKINSATDLYRWVIVFLGAIVILVVAITGILLGKDPGTDIPDGLIAIGSAAVGAIAGMLAQSPSK